MIFLKTLQPVVLALGSNMGDRGTHLEQAVALIGKEAGVKTDVCSSVYLTAPWGEEKQNSFLNMAMTVRTTLSAAAMMMRMLSIEEKMGRVRKGKWMERKIDIDIIFFGTQVIKNPILTVPHPLVHNRRFVLEPLNEIVPDWLHPVDRRSVREMLEACTDPLNVEKYAPAVYAL